MKIMERTYSLEELPEIAKAIIQTSKSPIYLFYGGMGVGKTTLIKEICKQMGVKDTVSSPTFGIVNEYESESGPVYHFDFYRITDQEEALDIGIEDYFYSGQPVFIEWPEKISRFLPETYVKISLEKKEDTKRHLSFVHH
jgi:tRNA threonylcarbamoyladenosine biosynthesis protein TsaE